MILFQSMAQVALYIAITVALLLWFAAKQNPVMMTRHFVQQLLTSKKYFLHFAALIAILIFNKVELSIEQKMNNPANFTSSIYGLEGNIVRWVQQMFEHPWLTTFLAYFYIVVFTAMLIASLLLYTAEKNYKLYYALCYAVMLNYMIAIPFYLFFPVLEVWAYKPSNVEFLMLQAFPTFETEYRSLSGLDNCFPSLHTSISVTLAILAIKSNNSFWRKFVPISAGIIIFSIFYMGIHWVTDMVGGVMLGVFASTAGIMLSENQVFPLSRKVLTNKKSVSISPDR
jgi:membrane-associated phospholipid phosphatase